MVRHPTTAEQLAVQHVFKYLVLNAAVGENLAGMQYSLNGTTLKAEEFVTRWGPR